MLRPLLILLLLASTVQDRNVVAMQDGDGHAGHTESTAPQSRGMAPGWLLLGVLGLLWLRHTWRRDD